MSTLNKLFLALIAVVMLSLAVPAMAVVIDPSNSNIQYMGRWNFDDPSAPWACWKGTSVKVRFDGTAITADLDSGIANEQYRVIIDGVPNTATLMVNKNRAVYTLASGLPSGTHVVELMKETFVATRRSLSVFYGFDITGTIMSPPAKPPMRIEWFGDSNMDGTSLYSEQDSGDHGSYYAYPAVVSRMLNAELNDESVGGATIDNGGDNDVRSFIFSEDYFNQDTSYRSGFAPDLIVINAGANDLGAGEATIKQRYKDAIADLRLVYGSTPHIILFNSYGWDINEPANYTMDLPGEVGGNLSICHFPWVPQHWHGSMVEHAGQANLLVDHILTLGLGFIKVQESEVFDGFGRNFDVANGSFEGVAKGGFNSFGWRYLTDGGIERVYDPSGAYTGNYYVRLTTNDPGGNYGSIQQGNDATGDFDRGGTSGGQQYTVSVMIRGANGGEQAQIIVDYQGQQIWTRADAETANFTVTSAWQQYSGVFTAPDGTWMTYVKVRADSGVIDVDAISVTGGSTGPVCGDATCDPGEDQCNCSADCGSPPATESNCTDGIDEDCDGGADCDDPTGDCDTDPACQSACNNNGTCETGEDCNNCPNDCISKTNGNPNSQYCCGDGTCEGAEDSSNCAVDCGSGPVCGDGTCDPGEDNSNCPADCPPSACNNNSICEPGEDCNNCGNDCDGVTGGNPANRYCCGNGVAETPEGDGTICDGNY